MPQKYIVLIPAYQPDAQLPEMLAKLASDGFQAVVVDDGSSPDCVDTFKRVEKYADVVRHDGNRGKGRAIKTGLAFIGERFEGEYTVVTMDADGQHSPDDALRICRAAEQSPGTLILGSRSMGRGTPLRSRFGNAVTRAVYRISTGKKVHDTQTGMRAFSSELLPFMRSVEGERYEYEMNVLLTAARRGISVSETEIETIYLDGNASSHFDILRDSFLVYREILKFSASSLAGFLTDYAAFGVMLFFTGNLRLSNIAARVVSASVNFTLNRKFVFRDEGGAIGAAVRYFMLAAAILWCDTVILERLVAGLGMNEMAAKAASELLMFSASWAIQRSFVFRRRKEVG